MKGIDLKRVNGEEVRVVIVQARWNSEITDQLAQRATKALQDNNVVSDNILHIEVPGAFELPFGAQQAIERHKPDVVICIGSLVKGETAHFEYIAQAVSSGIMHVQLQTGIPVIFGVLTCYSEEQAAIRASQDGKDHGYEWGLSALEMTQVV